MANTIRIKRRASNSNLGSALPTGLYNAELAFNEVNNTLYIGRGGNASGSANDATATVVAGDGVVWTGTQTFGTVNAGGGVYAYKDTYPVDPKLLATVDYVDDAISRGAGATLYPHAANADCATTSSLLTAAPFDKLQSFDDVRIAWAPTTIASYSETYPLSGAKTLQGVTLANGNRVLLLNHLQPGFKGIWVVNTSGAWTRATGAEYQAFYTSGKRIKVTEGTNANKIYEIAAPADRPTNENTRTFSSLTFNITTSQPVTSATAQYQRVVRAAADVYTVENNKIKVDGVVLNDGDRFLWTPQFGGDGGATPSDIFDLGSPQATAGIYRVDYSAVTQTGSAYAAAVRDQDLMLAAQFQAANTTKVLVREGTTNKQKIYTISAATPFTVGTTVPTFTYSSTYSASAQGFQGTPIIDGYQTQVENLGSNQIGSAILVKDEVDATYNGLYYIPALSGSFTTANVPWIRHSTADAAGEFVYGSYIRVLNGSVNKNLAFVQIGDGGEDKIITPSNEVPAGSGTTSAANNNPDLIVFQSAQASSDIVAGVGLAKANRTLYVKTASSSRITVTEAGVDLATVSPNPSTDGLSASTAYILTHVDQYGRVTDNSSTTITATDFRNKLSSISSNDTSTGTQNLVFSDSPALTGIPTAPTADPNTNTTQIATTAYVLANGGSSILGTNNAFTGANTFTNATGQTFRTGATADAIIVKGGGNTAGRSITLVTDTLSGSRTVTFPDHTGNYTLVGDGTAQTLTNKTLTAPKMTGTYIADTNNNELIKFPAVVASATNEITVTNAVNGAAPEISATGSADSNIDLKLTPKGTGAIFVNGSIKLATGSATSIADVNGNEIIKFPTTVTNATNEITVTNAINGAAPEISATGTTDANIDLKLTAKGTGVVTSTSNFTVASGKALNLSNTTVTAGTDVIGQGALTNDINIVTSAPNAPSGVTLPTATAGRVVVVVNRSSQTNTVKVYPASGGTINALVANAAFSVAANSTVVFRASSATQWYSELVDLVNGTTGTLAVGSGGTGATTFTSGALLKGAGTSAITTATAGTDFVVAGTTTVGKIITQAATATSGTSSLLITASTGTPTAGLVSGDLWNTSGVLKFYNGTATKDIAFTDGNITGTAAGLSATLAATSGGTGQSTYATGDFLYAGGTNPTSLTKLSKAGSGTVGALIQDGNSGTPSWQTVTGTGNVVRATSPQLSTSVTTDSTTFALLDTTATTINAFRAATAITIGSASAATTTIQSTQASSNSTTGALVVSGGLGVASASFFGGNLTVASNGSIGGDLTVTGNLTINGTTTTVNTNTLTVEDKNIEIGNAAALSNVSGTLGSGVPTMTVTSTNGMMAGQALTYVSGSGQFAGSTRILSVDTATQITLNVNPTSPGPIVFNVGGASNFTAVGGGVTIKGTADKTFQITTSNILDATVFNFTSSEHLNVVTGKTYKINDVAVLSATTLGSGVTVSSLQSVGTIGTGVWQGTAVAVAYGGTGAANAADARTNLGLTIGTNVQAYDAELAAIAGLTSAADKLPYFTGSGTASVADFTSTARSLLDDTSTSAMRTTLGLAIGTDVQAYDAELAAIAGLTSAADRLPYFTGSGTASLATFTTFGRSLVDDADNSAARTTLGLVIGTDVQAYNATLATVAGGTYSGDDSITTVGTIGTGTWQGTAVGPLYGGTGQTTYATGDLLYASAANTLSKLTKPASTTSILRMTSLGVPSWVDPCTAIENCTLDGGTF